MAKDTLAADPVLVLDRFGDEVQLACPLFQRRYVWGKRNIEQIFADLDTVIDGQYPKRFMGALVFNNERDTTAKRAGRYWIIDGQQRLTTLFLALLALAEEAAELGDQGRELAEDTFTTYLVSGRSQSKGEPKLRPTLVDSKQFEGLVAKAAKAVGITVKVQPHVAPGDATGTMTEGYRVIQGCIRGRLPSKDEATERLAALETIRNTVVESLEFVEIRLGSEHDPNEVFDRLNKEGEKLGILDLIRNEVLKHLDEEPQKAQATFSNDWMPFEDAFEDESAKAKYFFPFALTIDSGATQASTFRTLSDHLGQVDGSDSQEKVSNMVRVLRRHQSAYNAIHSGRFGGLNEPLREQVRRLEDMNRPSSVYPYVMQLLTATAEGQTSLNDASDCLAIVESFLVRRAFRGIEPTGLHAIFKKLWVSAGADPVQVRANIVSKTVVFPNDEEFANAIRTGDLYHRKICRYVLEEYERGTTTGDILKTFPPITIDHVVPQSRQGDWANAFTEGEHASLLHTWANLVPLSSESNSTKGTLGWDSAKKKLELETVFSTTKHLYASHTKWTAGDVDARATDLVEWALARWPY
ncbi:DUF262 domain-containing HNH endonuclease family protein [Microvirga sp. 0TCS3.31]